MRVSGEEYLRLSHLRPDYSGSTVAVAAGSMATASVRPLSIESLDTRERDEARRVADFIEEQLPDVREEVVASLRARIESGNYQVSGDQVAEMMIRRLIADRIR